MTPIMHIDLLFRMFKLRVLGRCGTVASYCFKMVKRKSCRLSVLRSEGSEYTKLPWRL